MLNWLVAILVIVALVGWTAFEGFFGRQVTGRKLLGRGALVVVVILGALIASGVIRL